MEMERRTFEDRGATKNEVAIGRVVRVTGLIEIQDVHANYKKKGG